MTEASTGRGDVRHVHPRRPGLVSLVIALLGIMGLAWWMTPGAMTPWSGTVTVSVDVGDAMYVGLNNAERDLTLLAARPGTSEGVDVELLVCTASADDRRIGAVASLDGYCSQIRPAQRGTPMQASPSETPATRDYLIARLTPTTSEPTALCGWDLVYRSGARVGVSRESAFQTVVNGRAEDVPALCG